MHRALALLVVVLLAPRAAESWDLFGHHVVGAIAWDRMSEDARRAAAELLLEAPPDAGLAALLPPNHRSAEARAREHFLKAGGWADLVRDELWPERKERYDRPEWHYVNCFWRSTPAGPELLEDRGTLGELVERLTAATATLSKTSAQAAERAIALAWVLHLVGDVHQPLHSSGRVTDLEPEGDRGGNDFRLGDPEASNLHYYWDSILKRSRRRHHSESYFGWVDRVADEIATAFPESALKAELGVDSPEAWSREGVEIAMRSAYPEGLARGVTPSRKYRDRVYEAASRQAALAGYRLADLLNSELEAP